MLIALVTGNMVGSGAFLTPSAMAGIGSISLLSLVVTTIGVLCLALVFAKMSLLVNKTGGPYAYAFAGFGEYMGFQTAYYYWIAVWVGNAAIVVAAVGYLNVFFPILNNPTTKNLTILGIIWSLTAVNIIGIRFAGAFQIITTILKFTPLVIVGCIGWRYFHPEYLTQNFNVTSGTNLSAFSAAIPLTLWYFIGLESATIPANAVDNPQRNIPLATILGTIIAAAIYILSNAAIFGMLPNSVLATSASPFANATEIIFGTWGKVFVAFGAVVACLGAFNGWILVAAQIPMAAAEDRLFPKLFAKCNQAGTPVAGLLITASLISILLLASNYLNLIQQFTLLIDIAVAGELVAYFYTTIAEIIIIKKKVFCKKDIFHITIAILAAIYSFYAIFSSSKEIIFYLTVFLLLTIPFYAIFKWKTKDFGP